jgi:hypothetical protein
VRQRRGRHAHLALGLRAVQAGDVPLGEQPAPGRIGDDHQFGDELVERAAAPAFADFDRAPVGIGEIAGDGEVVVVDSLRRRRFAAPPLAGVGEAPEVQQFVAEGEAGESADHGFGVEDRLDFVMPQVGGYMHHLQPGFLGNDLEIVVDREIQRNRRAIDAPGQRVAVDDGIGQHGDLVARHVDGGQAPARDRVERRAAREAERGCGDVDADARADAGQPDDRERVVDLGGGGVVDRKGGDIGARQIAGQFRRGERGKGRAFRELFMQEAAVVQVVGRPDRAALEQQLRRGQAGITTGGFEGLGFRLVAIGRIKQRVGQRGDFRRQTECLEFADPALDGERLLALLFQAGQRRREDVGRRLAEAALALAVEIDGRGVHGQQHRRRLDRGGVVSVVITGKIEKRKLAIACALPEEIRFDLLGQRCRLLQQGARRRLLETQQHRGGLDLAALAGGHLDLQRAVVVGHDAARLEAAILFEQYIHRRIITPRIQGFAA